MATAAKFRVSRAQHAAESARREKPCPRCYLPMRKVDAEWECPKHPREPLMREGLTFGEAILCLRRVHGLSQSALLEVLGYKDKNAVVNHWETGTTMPRSGETLLLLSLRFGLTLEHGYWSVRDV